MKNIWIKLLLELLLEKVGLPLVRCGAKACFFKSKAVVFIFIGAVAWYGIMESVHPTIDDVVKWSVLAGIFFLQGITMRWYASQIEQGPKPPKGDFFA